jgi:TIR domain/Bacterial SH3 domain
MAHDVFISHSSKDKLYADAVCARLESDGIRCWIAPRDILPGMSWGSSIIDAIEGAQLMVLVFSANANSSPQIEREVERALNHELTVVPLRIEQVAPGKNLEYFLGTPHWLDAVTPPFEQHLEYIAQTIKVLLERRRSGQALEFPRPPAAPPPPPPRPALAKKLAPWVPIGSVAAIAAVILIVLGWWLLRAGPVPSKFVGAWTMTNFIGPDRVQFILGLEGDGSYRYEVVYTESGRVNVRNGKVSLETADGLERSVGSVLAGSDPPSPSDLVDAAPDAVWDFIGKFSHTKVQLPQGSPFSLLQPGKPGVLGAKAQPAVWAWDTAFGKLAWLLKFQFDYQGDYAFTAHAVDVGHFTARDGKWKATSDVLDSQTHGGYSFVGNKTLVMAGTLRGAAAMTQTGNTLWERIGKAAPAPAASASTTSAAATSAAAGGSAIASSTPAGSPTATRTPAAPPIMSMDKKFLLSHDSPVYASPNSSSAVVARVRRGRWIHITGLTGNWLQVELSGGAVGFIPDKAVE